MGKLEQITLERQMNEWATGRTWSRSYLKQSALSFSPAPVFSPLKGGAYWEPEVSIESSWVNHFQVLTITCLFQFFTSVFIWSLSCQFPKKIHKLLFEPLNRDFIVTLAGRKRNARVTLYPLSFAEKRIHDFFCCSSLDPIEPFTIPLSLKMACQSVMPHDIGLP